MAEIIECSSMENACENTPTPVSPAMSTKSTVQRKRQIQASILTTPDKKLKFGTRHKATAVERASKSVNVNLVNSESEDEDEENGTLDETIDGRLEWKLTELCEKTYLETDQDLTEWRSFVMFAYSFYREHRKFPISIVILIVYLWLANRTNWVPTLLDQVIHPIKWAFTLPQKFVAVMDETVVTVPNSFGQKTVKDIFSTIATWVRNTGVMSYENLQMKHLRSIDADRDDTSVMYLCPMDVKMLFTSLMSCDISSAGQNLQDLSQCTATTSTSPTPVHTQTRLAVVHGSVAVKDSEELSVDTVDDVFSLMDPNVQTGSASLDIIAQTDTRSTAYKAEVKMKDTVFDIKIYNKDKIRNLEKNKWYTAAKYKVVGTCANNSTTLKQLLSVVRDTCRDVQQQSNMRQEKVWGFQGQ